VKAADVPLVHMTVPSPTSPKLRKIEQADRPIAALERMASPPKLLPTVISLPALEAIARGEVDVPLIPQFDTEDDSDLDRWRTPRERVGPVATPERILWEILERWDFRDPGDWVHLLADTLFEIPDRAVEEELQQQLTRLAQSPLRTSLAAATEIDLNVEFLADIATIHAFPEPFKLRGVIDLLVRDDSGRRIVAIDRGIAHEDDPWRGRQPGLLIQAWVASKQFGEWPVTIELFDLSTGHHHQLDPSRLSIQAAAEHFLLCANSARR
jgi:hypothetical protein